MAYDKPALTHDQLIDLVAKDVPNADMERLQGKRLTKGQRDVVITARIAKRRAERNAQPRERVSNADAVARHAAKHTAIERKPCEDDDRRAKLESDPVAWLLWYFAPTFQRPFEEPHLAIIRGAIQASDTGGSFLVAGERGLGKSTILWALTLYLKLSGRQSFPVCIPWASGALTRAMRFWKNALCFNVRLAADYPEYCGPFAASKGVPQRIAAMHWADKEEPTGAQLAVGDGMIVFPDSLGAIGGATINGNPRGLNHPQPDGTVVRPTIALLDDVQDREVAKSEAQVAETIATIDGDVGGMGEIGTRLPMLMSGNCICWGDVMAHYLASREWQSLRIGSISAWPAGWADDGSKARELWADWYELAREEDSADAADEFYEQHKDVLTDGFTLSAPIAWRLNGAKDGCKDEFRAIMREYHRMGESAFAAERQQEPISTRPTAEYVLTAQQVMRRIGNHERGVIPDDMMKVVACVDLNYHAASWCVLAGNMVPAYSVVDYGWWTPARGRPVWANSYHYPVEKAMREAIDAVVAMLVERYGSRLDGVAIDRGGAFDTTVRQAVMFLRARYNPLKFYAAKGFGATHYRPPVAKTTITGRGHLAHSEYSTAERVPVMDWDSQTWHMITQRAFLFPEGSPGSICLFRPPSRSAHSQFADEMTADKYDGQVERRGKMEILFKETGRNEMGDVIAMGGALLSLSGISPDCKDNSREARRQVMRDRKREIMAQRGQGTRTPVTPAAPAPVQPAAPVPDPLRRPAAVPLFRRGGGPAWTRIG